MSFVRAGRPQQHGKAKRPVRPKKTAAARREWVSTVNDLSVHKLTPTELNHRHEIHQSHNKAAAQWELRERALKSRLRLGGSPAPLDSASLSIIREIFSDQLLLQDVLARSDRAMAVVKDLFDDSPRRQIGHPSVTMAPHSGATPPVVQRPDPPTQLSLLSQSMMDQQALNECEASEEEHSDEEPSAAIPHHKAFGKANVRKIKAKTRKVVQQRHRDEGCVTPRVSGRAPDPRALNATAAVRRIRSRQIQAEEEEDEPSELVSQVLNPELPLTQSEESNTSQTVRTRKCSSKKRLEGSSVASLSGDQSSLGHLQSMLGDVEAALDSLCPETVSDNGPKQERAQGLTGFSVALVSTLGRVVSVLKQREEEAQSEAGQRGNLEEKLREQQRLIDALTAEIMTLREETCALQAELQRRTADMEQKLDTVVLAVGVLMGAQNNTVPDSNVRAEVSRSSPPVAECVPEQAHVLPPLPPQRRSHPQILENPQRQHLLPAHLQGSHSGLQAYSSASSLTSLPLASLPSASTLSLTSDPLRSQLSPEAMLAEIAELNRQNELIKAQLGQAKRRQSGAESSPSSVAEQRRSSSGSVGRTTPQSSSDGRRSASLSSERRSQSVQAAEAEQQTQQGPSHPLLSVSCVQQRLLELNRQSAAARGRLLQLIEQQKQSLSARVSPSASPVPASAFSPDPAAQGGSPEVSILTTTLEPLTARDRRSAGYEVHARISGGDSIDGRSQAGRQRQQDGWLALSSNVR